MKTEQEILAAYEEYGSVRKAAEALGLSKDKVWRTVRRLSPVNVVPVQKEKLQAQKLQDEIRDGERVITGKNVRTLDELLDAAGVDSEEWVVTRHKANTWQALAKDSEIIQLYQVTAHLERAPKFFIQPVEPIEKIPQKRRESMPANRCALIVPDIQAGFRRVEDMNAPGGYNWLPLHDRKALDCVNQIAELLEENVGVDSCVMLGENLDLAPWSTRYTASASLRMTTSAALRELYAGFLVPLREAIPYAELHAMEGNHEKRIADAIDSKLGEAAGLRRADTIDGEGVMSIPELLALDSIDCEYHAPYGKPFWLYDQIRISHGSVVRQGGGATAQAVLKTATSSMIWGHVHRLEMAQVTRQTPEGPKVLTAASPGCLCRSEIGTVPGVLGNTPDWQQGVAIVYEHEGKHSIQLIPIVDGVAFVDGEMIVGRGIDEDWAERTGLPF